MEQSLDLQRSDGSIAPPQASSKPATPTLSSGGVADTPELPTRTDLHLMAEVANSKVEDYEYRGTVRYMEANFHHDALRGDTVDPVYGRQEEVERSLYDSALELVLEKHT